MGRFSTNGPLDSPLIPDGDSFFSGVNARLRPDQLKPGELAYSQNGRMDVEGAWQPRKGNQYFGGNVEAPTFALTIPFYLYASVNITSADRVTTVVTVETATPHGFTTATQVGIAGLTGTVDPNGNRLITVTGADTFTFEIAGAVGSETYGGTGTAGAPFILDDAQNGAWGSCRFSDPSTENTEYIIQAQNENAVAINLATAASTTIAYPTGITVGASVEMLQAFNKVYLFRDGATALSWNGSFSGTPAFVKVANGTYTQPKVFTAASNASCTQGVVTIAETGHGLSVGDIVKIFDYGVTALPEGGSYVVKSVPTADSFTFFADVDDFSATSVVLGQAQSLGQGFTHMPAPPWGVYHQRRLIVPFFYTTSGASGSETVTDRDIRDEILMSDILDGDTYDKLQNQLKVTAGIADFVQWVHPFTDDNAVIFCRNSLHLLSGISGSLADIELDEITRECGLVARRSVVTIGNKIYFLSDNGVYATEFGDLYNLRGAGLPLSEPIDPIIKRINTLYAENAVGVFHNNRYYLAVPLDSSTVNNALLIYNLLNQKWESVDTVNADDWDIANLISAGAGGVNKLYAVNRLGGIHILEYREDDTDYLALGPGVNPASVRPESYATTRQYTHGTTDRKKFNTFELHVESSENNASNADIAVETENTDSATTLGTISGYLGETLGEEEDASMRGRIGNMRGYGLQLTFTPSQGRPKMRMVRIDAIPASNSITQAT
jgi:hypothetical protein